MFGNWGCGCRKNNMCDPQMERPIVEPVTTKCIEKASELDSNIIDAFRNELWDL